jgi:hypothetical protein
LVVQLIAISSVAMIGFDFSSSVSSVAFAADITFPIVEPRLPIVVHAKNGSKTTRGAYEVYQLFGDCRIEQAGFSARGDRIELWVDHFASSIESDGAINASNDNNKRWMYKAIIRVDGAVEVEWLDEQRLKDTTWMGRLYSHRAPILDVEKWEDQLAEPKTLYADSIGEFKPRQRTFDPSFPTVPPSVSTADSWTAASKDASRVELAQFEQLPPGSTPTNGIAIPQPEAIRPMELPAPSSVLGREGSLFDSSANSSLGGMVVDGDVSENVPTQDRTSLQLPTDTLNQRVPPGSPGLAQGFVNPNSAPRVGAQSFAFEGRGGINPDFETIARGDSGETLIGIKRGIRLKFTGATVMTGTGPMELGTVVLEADRALIWTADLPRLYSQKIDGVPIEVYLEGNVVFQQGPRTIYADRMYYNVQSETGMVLGAEILTPAPQFEGIVRLKADVIEQRSRQSFLAYNAAMTSSRIGVPRYWLQADRLSLEDPRPSTDQGQSAAIVKTGTTNMEATARNNFVYLGGLPVLYWPVMTTNINAPNFYLRSAKVKKDDLFGQQAFLDWDLHQLLGLDGPDGTDWRLSTDYLSKRGFALGTTYRYNLPNTFLPGPATGFFDAWGLNDKGLDTLGIDRINLTPEQNTRGRFLFQHRQYLTRDLELWAEAGLVSDRNFLEQYFEREWDEQKDMTTSLRLRRYADNRMLDIVGQPRINRFHTETEWLPKIDHFILGQSIFDRLTWYAHSNVAYAHLRTASTPINIAEQGVKFQPQPWEVDAEGIRAGTRQELALPLNTGPFKLVPYVNGEVMTWGEDVTGNSLTRLTGQTGVRATLPTWKAYPEVQNRLFNVNGIAHKINWNTEFFYADTNRNIEQLPLYDPLDDNAQEHFRRRLIFNTFGGVLPPQFDSRSFAIRQGLQRYVTASSSEVVEDQMQVRFGLDQRWQTKRGLAGRERIADLVEFDVNAILFPKADRDNFGQTVGAIDYDFRFHIGDRYTFLSDGYFDVFDKGLNVISGGMLLTRPGRGDYYFGLTALQGPINTIVANSNINYRMNEKWLVMGGSTFDFREVGNVGQSLSLVRIGESFLAQFGIQVDSGRDNASFFFNLEPRFFPYRGLGSLGGQNIPPAGRYGLE